jgi:flagellar motor switch protein FliG
MTQESEITGPQRVAAFLLSLDQEAGAELMRRLDPRVIPDVAQAMTELDPKLCTPDAVASLFGDLARSVFEPSTVRARDARELTEILESSFGAERAQQVLGDIELRRRKHKPFAFIESRPPSAAYRVLASESPAVVALVLAHVSPALSAEILSGFEPEAALDVVKRMTTISPPEIDTMLSIADDLERRLDELGSGPVARDREEEIGRAHV